MKKYILTILSFLAIVVAFNSCEDPDDAFNPQNPDLAISAVVGTDNSTQSILVGANRQLSLAMNQLVVISEIASDNYTNTQTFFNQFLDNLAIDATDDDIDDTQFAFHRLREIAITGRDVISPDDATSTPDQVAELNFFIGLSHLMFGENFTSVPAEPGGVVMDAATHLNTAISNFEVALNGTENSEIITACNLGIARAHYRLGNRDEAVSFSNAAISSGPNFIRFVQYDAVNGPGNTMQDAIFDRGTFDDLQPLPRLDFLDPKYNGSVATTDVDIPLLKIEEAYLILIEAAISNGDLGTAQQSMRDLIGLVATRPMATFNDAGEGRDQDFPGSRPDTTSVLVAASSSDDLRPGLVIDRNDGDVTVPVVSGTSVTLDIVDSISDSETALEILYLMRQEIFIAEGRRMADLGIRFVTSDVEFRSNSNVEMSDIIPVIPDFIGNISSELDAFDYDANAGTAVIMHNLNRIIVQNRTSDLVVPFE